MKTITNSSEKLFFCLTWDAGRIVKDCAFCGYRTDQSVYVIDKIAQRQLLYIPTHLRHLRRGSQKEPNKEVLNFAWRCLTNPHQFFFCHVTNRGFPKVNAHVFSSFSFHAFKRFSNVEPWLERS